MLNDKELEKLSQPLVDIYREIELELIQQICARFDRYDTIGGSLEWQLKCFDKIAGLNASAVKVFAKYSSKTEKEIVKMLKKASLANFKKSDLDKAVELGLALVSYDKLMSVPRLKTLIQRSYDEVNKTIKLINTKAVESTKQAYMGAINKAYLETASGIKSYDQAIMDALKNMADAGITGATYVRKNGKAYHYDLEGVVRRDVITATNSLSNDASLELAEDVGYGYVETSQHMGARTGNGGLNYTNHAWWQGKQYKLQGSENGYPNFYETCGYGDIQGIGGVNCRHRTFPFYPGVSEPAKHIDEEQNAELYKKQQRLRAMERNIRKLRKEYAVLKELGTPEEKKKKMKEILSYSHDIAVYCKDNGLKRQENREVVNEL